RRALMEVGISCSVIDERGRVVAAWLGAAGWEMVAPPTRRLNSATRHGQADVLPTCCFLTGFFHRGAAAILCPVPLFEPGVAWSCNFGRCLLAERCLRPFRLQSGLFERGAAAIF